MKFSELVSETASEKVTFGTKILRLIKPLIPSIIRVGSSFNKRTEDLDVVVRQTVKGDTIFVDVMWQNQYEQKFDISNLVDDDSDVSSRLRDRYKKHELARANTRTPEMWNKIIKVVIDNLQPTGLALSNKKGRWSDWKDVSALRGNDLLAALNTHNLDLNNKYIAIRFTFSAADDPHVVRKNKRAKFDSDLRTILGNSVSDFEYAFGRIYYRHSKMWSGRNLNPEFIEMVKRKYPEEWAWQEEHYPGWHENARTTYAAIAGMKKDPKVLTHLKEIEALANQIGKRYGFKAKLEMGKDDYTLAKLKITDI